MFMVDEKIEAINERFRDKGRRTDIRLGECLGLSIIKGNTAFCNAEELTKVIEDLTTLREAILEETGIKF